MTKRLSVLVALCMLGGFSASSFAQGVQTGTIRGTVKDQQDLAIPGVTVTATNVGTGVSVTAITNESGAYNIQSLLPGKYKLSAELPGFRTQVFNDVELGATIAVRCCSRATSAGRRSSRR